MNAKGQLHFECQPGFRYIPNMPQAPPIVLTIAGFDPSSGAGVTGDIKTIAAHSCYGVSAITAATIQSTAGVRRVVPLDPALLLETLEELARDVKIAAVHIGMLGGALAASQVICFLKNRVLKNIVLDPILESSSGAALLDREGTKVLVRDLLPLVDVVTPNTDEAAALTGATVTSESEMVAAADRLLELGAKAVVVTGGHLERAIDLLKVADGGVHVFRADRVRSHNTHGTGCAFSTALASQLALGRDLPTAVLLAKAYVLKAIESSYNIGDGIGPINHMHRRNLRGGGN